MPTHAAEIVQDDAGDCYVTHAGWQQGGLWLAPLTWTAGEVALGRKVVTPHYHVRVQTWPAARIEAFDVDPLSRANYRRTHDDSFLGTAPLLAVGPTDAREFAGAPAQVHLSPDHTRLHLTGAPFGTHPVRADWLLTFMATVVQSDVSFSVANAVLDLREVGVSIDTSLPRIGDGVAPCRSGDAGGFGAWTLASDSTLSMVAAYRAGSAWRAENRWFEAPHGAVAWQALRQLGGAAWPTGIYSGGTWRVGASAGENDVDFAESFAKALNTVR